VNAHSGAKPEWCVTQILQEFLPAYLRDHALPVHQLKVLDRLAACRSPKLGWSLWQCQQCRRAHWQPNGCGDRHCPGCQHQRTAAWLDKQRQALLPVRYYHWVFTLPALLRPLALQNQKLLYDLLFDSASASLLECAVQRLGAQIGLTALLHTWGANLMDHPHLHCLVTGGGLTPENSWAGPKQTRWLFPIHQVGALFKSKFCAGLLLLHTAGQLQFHGKLEPLKKTADFAALFLQISRQSWNVFAKGSVVGSEAVLQYLGRYTHRVALSNSRLQQLDRQARTVTFTYKDYADQNKIKPLTLSGSEFIRRLCLHILPQGFTKIRHYGLLANNRRQKFIPLARAALEKSPWRFEPKAAQPPASTAKVPGSRFTCPFCQAADLRCLGRGDSRGNITFFNPADCANARSLRLDSS
jgi:hypothetical protein